MSCTDPWVIEQRLRDAAKEETYESSFAGIQESDSLLTTADLGENIISIPADGIIAAQTIEWVQHQLSIESVLADRGPGETCTEIFVRGATYLLIDNDGPEEMNPIVLQRQIVEMRKELDRLRPTPIVGSEEHDELVTDFAKEYECWFGDSTKTEDLIPTYSGYGGYGDSTKIEDLIPKYSGYGSCYAPCEFNLADLSLTSETVTPGAEIKLVSQEEADYERAMSMIGK